MGPFIRSALAVLGIILLFTGIDFAWHNYKTGNGFLDDTLQFGSHSDVPKNYFVNKILYGTVILFASLFLLPKLFRGFNEWSWTARSGTLAAIVVLLLSVRYYFSYSYSWNLSLLMAHFAILAPLIYLVYRLRLLGEYDIIRLQQF